MSPDARPDVTALPAGRKTPERPVPTGTPEPGTTGTPERGAAGTAERDAAGTGAGGTAGSREGGTAGSRDRAAYRPALRDDVVLGPPLRSADTVVHHVKDPRTGWFYRVGPREHFVMTRLDGRHTLDDIAGDYLAEFGRRLGPEQWRQIFTMLGGRQLLAGATDPAALERLTEARAAGARAARSPLFRRIPLVRPDAWCAAAARRLRWAFTAWFVVPALAAVLVLEVFVATHLGALAADARGGPGLWLTVPAALLGVWAIAAVHETAHGVTCKHFGGAVPEIGVMWRFPMLAPYCKTDDVVLFPWRRARVATAFAGMFAGLLALLPVLAWWVLASGHPALRAPAAELLVFGSVATWLNLVPLLQLDGYHMLAHALGVADLRAGTLRYARLLLARDPRRRAYARADRWIYPAYGAASAVLLGGGYLALCALWFSYLDRWSGPVVAVVVPAGVTLVLAGFLAYARRSAAAKREERAS